MKAFQNYYFLKYLTIAVIIASKLKQTINIVPNKYSVFQKSLTAAAVWTPNSIVPKL